MISLTSILFPPSLFRVTAIKPQTTGVHIRIESPAQSVQCPYCGQVSSRHHSSYSRQIQDTPLGSMTVWLQVKARRFRCPNPDCHRQTFAEQFQPFVGRRKRRTSRLLACFSHIGLALGGAAGARLGAKLKILASGRMILQLLRLLPCPVVSEARIVGIDDWAFRKGSTYGTIIVDHESGHPVDVLPGRDGELVREWLAQHPSIKIVTRDRSGEYREAITQALPDAIQVADRWHLHKNLHAAMVRHLTKRYQQIKEFVTDIITLEQLDTRNMKGSEKRRRYAPGPTREAIHSARTASREAKFAYAKEQYAKGVYITDIAKALNMSRQGVIRWLKQDRLPPDRRGRYKRVCLIDPYAAYLDERLEEGCTNKSQLWREIRDKGYTGTREMVGKWIRQNYPSQRRSSISTGTPPATTQFALPTVIELAWLLIRPKSEFQDEELALWQLLQRDPQLVELRTLARQFTQMVNERQASHWEGWHELVEQSSLVEIKRFARVLNEMEQLYWRHCDKLTATVVQKGMSTA